MFDARDAPPANMAERRGLGVLLDYLRQMLAVAGAEVQKLRHDPWELLMRATQPVLWLMLFGKVMAQVRGMVSGEQRYLDFLSAGILAQSVLFVAIFYGISAIWERDLGVLQRYLVSPAPRSALVLGKALSAAVRGLSQAVIVYLLALLIGVRVSFAPRSMLGVIVVIGLGSGLFWSAARFRSPDRYDGGAHPDRCAGVSAHGVVAIADTPAASARTNFIDDSIEAISMCLFMSLPTLPDLCLRQGRRHKTIELE